jgi:hypothetical protein
MSMLSRTARVLNRSQVVETAAAKTSSFGSPLFSLPQSGARQALAGQTRALSEAAGAETAEIVSPAITPGRRAQRTRPQSPTNIANLWERLARDRRVASRRSPCFADSDSTNSSSSLAEYSGV